MSTDKSFLITIWIYYSKSCFDLLIMTHNAKGFHLCRAGLFKLLNWCGVGCSHRRVAQIPNEVLL